MPWLPQDRQLPAAGAEAATAEAVVVSTEAVSVAAVFMVMGSTGEASAVALFTAVVVSVGDISPVAVSTAVAFVVTVLVITGSPMMSSSPASAFRGGGVTRTDITATTINHTITMAMETDTDTDGTVTTVAPVTDTAMAAERVMDMAMAAEPVTDTALAADQGMCGVRGVGDKPRLRLLEYPGRGYVGVVKEWPSNVRRQIW